MSSEVQEQSANYNLADLKPALEKASGNNTLLDSLPIWLSAQTTKSAGRGRSTENTHQYGVQKLRELILDLAVRGKLVPQDPNDDPASVLLKKIAEEKSGLIKDGKLKKQNTQARGDEIDVIFSAPVSWSWVKLGDIVEVLDSLRKPITKTNRKEGPYPYYGASGIVDYVADFIFDEPLVLVGEDGAKWGRGEQTAFSISGKTWVNNHAHVLRAKDFAINQSYLVYYLTASDLGNYITGMTVPKLNQKRLVSIPIPLPPIDEQHRIVKKVDELMALCDKLEQQQANAVQAHDTLVKVLLDTLSQSDNAEEFQQNWRRIAEHFDTLFTTESSIDQLKQTMLQLAVMGKLVPQDPNDEPASALLEKIADEKALLIKEGKLKRQKPLPEIASSEKYLSIPINWEWVKFDYIAQNKNNALKAGPFGSALKKSMYVEAGYKIYGQEQVISGDENYGDYFINQTTYDSLASCSVEPDDILISLVGTIGKVLVLSENCQAGIINPRLVKLSLNKKISRSYIQKMLASPLIQDELADKSHGGTMNILNLGILRELSFPLPPVEEQHRIVEKVDELMTLCDRLKKHLNQTQTLQQQLADSVVETAVN
jgi:type I restriction enzyme S subunit